MSSFIMLYHFALFSPPLRIPTESVLSRDFSFSHLLRALEYFQFPLEILQKICYNKMHSGHEIQCICKTQGGTDNAAYHN